ncbi:hypothetical protein [Ralstonia mojiangensis]|uniref:hypothetical protein n=1 Tax=Ralstonia mojiangensis TaxID=2953895 RepID=UPI002091564A|nr:hypothetical protein [Ralstonia mojiangensis]MCO5412417.1 hypothetical protein [Ralstonia mojiangensis]
MYRIPALYSMPSTDFYAKHATEIQEALQPHARWELLRRHALPKLELEAGMSKEDCRRHGYPGKTQYFDAERGIWSPIEVPAIRWFDGRERIREGLLEAKEELEAKVAKTLQRYKDAATKDPSEKRLQTLAGYEKFIRELLPDRLRKFGQEKAQARAWLRRLDATPDFSKTLFSLVRQAENDVRQSVGVPAIGEAWVSETELLYRVRQLLPNMEVIAHGQPRWLGRQHLDIWIPGLNVAVEYHGVQHYRAVDYFGGEAAFKNGQERDNRKRELCQKNGVRLVEIAYDRDVDDTTLKSFLVGG